MNLSPNEVLIIAVLALIVLGPQRLPEAAKTIGKAFREVRKVSTTIRAEIDAAFKEPMDEFKATLEGVSLEPYTHDSDSKAMPTGESARSASPNRAYRPADELPEDDGLAAPTAPEEPAHETQTGRPPLDGEPAP
ncbi:MAG: Tat protein translocase TatB subunit [Candidatus Poriferisodalaceae bacterium]